MCEKDIYQEIFGEVKKIPVIDTHEHLLWSEEYRVNDETDVLKEYLAHYMKSDLISAGLSLADYNKVTDVSTDIDGRWKIVEPYWEVCRYTGYGNALDIAVKGIYNIERIDGNNIRKLNEEFLKRKTIGHYEHVLKNLCGIRTSLLDIWTFRLDGENRLFKRVWQPQNFINPMPSDGSNIVSYIEDNFSIKVRTLEDWLEAFEREFDYMLNTYAVNVIKSSIAYSRSLRFEKTDYAKVKALFASAIGKWEKEGRDKGETLEFPVEVQDFMMHYALNLANKRNLTFQFHTGLLEGNGNVLNNSDPLLMNNLFIEYPDVNFDLFHISYPFQNVAAALCKMFPNVFIDMCWAHIISPSASMQALECFLDSIPYNKISAFGGDYLFVDGVYGHLHIARQNVSRVLAKKVADGIFSVEKAIEIATALFYGNPKRIFKLDDC